MESAPDLLHLFVRALTLVATSLDRWFHIPWPVPIAALFMPILSALNVAVWCLRGMSFPAYCNYPLIKQGLCSRATIGEWNKCWYHGLERWRKTDRHLINPKLERWKDRVRKGVAIETGEIQGRGFLRMRSHSDTLLYHQGLARRPGDVFNNKMPKVFGEYKSRVVERWGVVKSLGLQGLFPVTEQGKKLIATSELVPGVIQATRITLGLVMLGLILVIVSLVVPPLIGVIVEYCATYTLVTALAVTYTGIVKPDDATWLRHSLMEAAKWIAGLTGLAALGGLIGLYAHEVVDAVKTAAETAFSGFIFLIVACLLYIFGTEPKKQSRRVRKRTKSRKRR